MYLDLVTCTHTPLQCFCLKLLYLSDSFLLLLLTRVHTYVLPTYLYSLKSEFMIAVFKHWQIKSLCVHPHNAMYVLACYRTWCSFSFHSACKLISSCSECLQTSIAKYENLLGPKSSSVAAAMTTLGSTWTSLGDNFKSKQLFEKALSIQEELYEPNHPSVSVALITVLS